MMKNICKIFVILIMAGLLSPAISVAQWVQTNGPYAGRIQCVAVSGSSIFAGTSDAGVFLSTDHGASWTAANSGMESVNIQAFAVRGNDVFAGTIGGVFRSTNNGVSWQASASSSTPYFVMCLAVSGSYIFAGTSDNGVYRSSDNGASWAVVDSGMGAITRGTSKRLLLFPMGKEIQISLSGLLMASFVLLIMEQAGRSWIVG